MKAKNYETGIFCRECGPGWAMRKYVREIFFITPPKLRVKTLAVIYHCPYCGYHEDPYLTDAIQENDGKF